MRMAITVKSAFLAANSFLDTKEESVAKFASIKNQKNHFTETAINMTTEFPSLGEEVIFLRKENQRLAEKYDNLAKEFISLDRISEFGAEGFSITTHPVIGLQRWADKQYMVSFFPTDIKGNRLQYQSGIDKIYDLFLTEEQVEVIIEEYNKRNKNV